MKQDDLVTISVVLGILGAIGTGMAKLFKKSSKIDLNEIAIKDIKDEHEKEFREFRSFYEKSISQLKESVDKDSRDLRESLEVVKNSDIKNLNAKVDSLQQSINDVQTNLTTVMNNSKEEILKMFITLGKKDSD